MDGIKLDTGGATRSRTGLNGFAGRGITALLSRHVIFGNLAEASIPITKLSAETKTAKHICIRRYCDLINFYLGAELILIKPNINKTKCGAGNEARTRDLNLGKVALYQLSYSRIVVTLCHR